MTSRDASIYFPHDWVQNWIFGANFVLIQSDFEKYMVLCQNVWLGNIEDVMRLMCSTVKKCSFLCVTRLGVTGLHG